MILIACHVIYSYSYLLQLTSASSLLLYFTTTALLNKFTNFSQTYSPHSYLLNLVNLIHQSHDNFLYYDISMRSFENLSSIENMLLQTHSPCILLISLLGMLFLLQINSFRAVLTTDGSKTFVIFKYGDINWSRSRKADSHAMVSKLSVPIVVTINCSGVWLNTNYALGFSRVHLFILLTGNVHFSPLDRRAPTDLCVRRPLYVVSCQISEAVGRASLFL